VQAEAVGAGETGSRVVCDVFGVDFHPISEAQHPLAGARARCDPPLNRGGEQLSQEGVVLCEPVRLVSETTPLDDAGYAASHTLQDPLQLLGSRRRGGVKAKGPIIIGRPESAVEEQRVEVDIEVQCPAESLHEGDCTSVSWSSPHPAATTPERGEDGAHEDAQHVCRQLAIVGQAVAQTER
jgi:hypothetical protein